MMQTQAAMTFKRLLTLIMLAAMFSFIISDKAMISVKNSFEDYIAIKSKPVHDQVSLTG